MAASRTAQPEPVPDLLARWHCSPASPKPSSPPPGQVVLTREGRHLLEARLGHLNRRVIPELRLPGVAVVAEDRPGGSDTGPARRRGDGGLPGTQQQFLFVHPLEAALDSVRISASSPLGRAVLGRRAGDLVDVASPAGRVRPAMPSA
jgi:hypothetical protein